MPTHTNKNTGNGLKPITGVFVKSIHAALESNPDYAVPNLTPIQKAAVVQLPSPTASAKNTRLC